MCENLNYTALAVQMAGRSPKGICQLAIRVIRNGNLITSKSFLIKPPSNLKFTFSEYHGITKNLVATKPTLAEVWPEIKEFIENQNVVVYWIEHTQKWLESSLETYGISAPTCNYIDVLSLLHGNRTDVRLSEIAKSINFDDDFQTGDSSNNVELYQAVIEYLIKCRSKKIQKLFGISFKSQNTQTIENTTDYPSTVNTKIPSQKCSSTKLDNATKASTGCLFPIFLILTLVITLISC